MSLAMDDIELIFETRNSTCSCQGSAIYAIYAIYHLPFTGLHLGLSAGRDSIILGLA